MQQIEPETDNFERIVVSEAEIKKHLESNSRSTILGRFSPQHKIVLAYLASRHIYKISVLDKTQTNCWPSIRSIARALGRSESRSGDILRELEAALLIRRIERKNENGSPSSNLYRLTGVLVAEVRLANAKKSELSTRQNELNAAIEEEREYQSENLSLRKVRGLRSSAKAQIGRIKKLIAAGKAEDSKGRNLTHLLNHWQQVFDYNMALEAQLKESGNGQNYLESSFTSAPSRRTLPPNSDGPSLRTQTDLPSGNRGLTSHLSSQSTTSQLTPPEPKRELPKVQTPPVVPDEQEEECAEFFNVVKGLLRIKITAAAKRKFISIATEQGLSIDYLQDTAKRFAESPYLRATTTSLNRLLHLDTALNGSGKNGNRIGDDLMRKRVLDIVRMGVDPMENSTVKEWKCSEDELYAWLGIPVPQASQLQHSQVDVTKEERIDESPSEDLRSTIPPCFQSDPEPVAEPTAEVSAPAASKEQTPELFGTQTKPCPSKKATNGKSLVASVIASLKSSKSEAPPPRSRDEYAAAIGQMAKAKGEAYYQRFVKEIYPDLKALEQLQEAYRYLKDSLAKAA